MASMSHVSRNNDANPVGDQLAALASDGDR
jgi:hypothetical protein